MRPVVEGAVPLCQVLSTTCSDKPVPKRSIGTAAVLTCCCVCHAALLSEQGWQLSAAGAVRLSPRKRSDSCLSLTAGQGRGGQGGGRSEGCVGLRRGAAAGRRRRRQECARPAEAGGFSTCTQPQPSDLAPCLHRPIHEPAPLACTAACKCWSKAHRSHLTPYSCTHVRIQDGNVLCAGHVCVL